MKFVKKLFRFNFFKRKKSETELVVDQKIKKSHFFRIFFRACRLVFFLSFALIISFIIALSQHDLEDFKETIIHTAESSFGAELQINGKMSWVLSLKPKIILKNVTLNMNIDSNKQLKLHADSITVTIKVLSFLRNHPFISQAKFVNTDIAIINNNLNKKTTLNDSEIKELGKFPFKCNFNLKSVEFSNTKILYKSANQNFVFNPEYFTFSIFHTDDNIKIHSLLKHKNNQYALAVNFLELQNNFYPIKLHLYNSDLKLKSLIKLNVGDLSFHDYSLDAVIKNLNTHLNYLGITDVPPLADLDIKSSGLIYNNTLIVDSLNIQTKESDLKIKAKLNFQNKKPDISLELNSNRLNLWEVFPTLYGNYIPEPDPTDRPLNAFKDTPLYTDYIFPNYNAEMKINVDKLIMYRKMEATKASVLLSLRNNILNLAVDNNFYKGNVKTIVYAKYISKILGVDLIASSRAENINPGLLLKSMNYNNTLIDLPSNFDFYFVVKGADLEHLMSSLSGRIHVYSTGSGILLNSSKYIIGQDFLSGIHSDLVNLIDKNEQSENQKVNCAVVNLKFKDGKIDTDKGIALETNMVNLMGNGKVDFSNETLKAFLISIPNKGLKINLSRSVLDAFEISGSISEPSVKISESGILSKTIATGITSFALAPFTGGLSIFALAGLGFATSTVLSSWLADSNPCQTANTKPFTIEDDDPDYIKNDLNKTSENIWNKVNSNIKLNFNKYFKLNN